MLLRFIKIVFILSIAFSKIYSQQMVYTPINPSFGGSSFNGSTLLSEAQAQNGFTASVPNYNSYQTDPLQSFKTSLNSQILSLLSRDLITKVFGENAFTQAGQYQIGDYMINVTPGNSGIHIDITDTSKGSSTTIDIPYY